MTPPLERAVSLLDGVHSQPEAAPAFPDALARREVAVLRLIAAGKSNLEIAEELVIAEGTA